MRNRKCRAQWLKAYKQRRAARFNKCMRNKKCRARYFRLLKLRAAFRKRHGKKISKKSGKSPALKRRL
jgi:hypothetical protein